MDDVLRSDGASPSEGVRRGNAVAQFRGAMRTSLFRTSFFLLLRTGVNAGLGFLFWLVVARLYFPSDVGIAAALFSMILFLARIAAVGLPQGVLRFLPADEDKVGLINGAFTVSAIMAFAIGAVFLAGLDLWASSLSFVRADAGLIAALLVSVLFFTVDGVVDNAFTAARRAEYGLVRTTLFYGLRLPLAVLFVPWGIAGISAAWTLSLVISILSAAALLPRFFPGYRPRATLRGMRSRRIFAFSLWNYGTGILAGASFSFLPLLILNRIPGPAGEEAAAHFFVPYSIVTLLYAVPHSFATSLLVEGSYVETNMPAERRRTVRYSAPLLALGIAGCILVGPWLLSLLGQDYAGAGYGALVLLALASPILLVTGIFASDLQVQKRARPIFFVTALSLAVTVGFAFLTLPELGVLGVAGGVVAGQATKLGLYVSLRYRRGPRSNPAAG
ncbi:MAG TPA: oligosaccharide flippase family protein [Thermoplasmata archaeon]|nr:oligosaccharide flippase family protein [Thermoplasmata archaeon]